MSPNSRASSPVDLFERDEILDALYSPAPEVRVAASEIERYYPEHEMAERSRRQLLDLSLIHI